MLDRLDEAHHAEAEAGLVVGAVGGDHLGERHRACRELSGAQRLDRLVDGGGIGVGNRRDDQEGGNRTGAFQLSDQRHAASLVN